MDSHNHVKFRVNVIAVSVKDKMTNFKVIRSEIEWTPHIAPAITQGRIIVIIASINKSYIWYMVQCRSDIWRSGTRSTAWAGLKDSLLRYFSRSWNGHLPYRSVVRLTCEQLTEHQAFSVFIRSLIFSHLRANQMIIIILTSRCTVRWPLRHAAFPGNYRQISQKRSFFADEMYSTICVEWAGDHFSFGLTKLIKFCQIYARKTIFTFSYSATLTFNL